MITNHMTTAAADPDLQPLFSEPVLEQRLLDPGHTNHTNHVWLVRLADQEVVVRLNVGAGEFDGPFWWGCNHLFGSDPRRVSDLAYIHDRLLRAGGMPVPRVLRTATLGERDCLIVEWLPGTQLRSFIDLSDAALEDFGAALERQHRLSFDWCGHPCGHRIYPLGEFHRRAAETMRALTARSYASDPAIQGLLEEMCRDTLALPPPEDASLVLVDMDPDQYLTAGQRVTALVDAEGCVVGPRALDFVALEYILDRRPARALARGYERMLPLPELAPVRRVYRYLYRLIEIQSATPIADWLAWPAWFDEGAAA
jgi:hypothetical protein